MHKSLSAACDKMQMPQIRNAPTKNRPCARLHELMRLCGIDPRAAAFPVDFPKQPRISLKGTWIAIHGMGPVQSSGSGHVNGTQGGGGGDFGMAIFPWAKILHGEYSAPIPKGSRGTFRTS